MRVFRFHKPAIFHLLPGISPMICKPFDGWVCGQCGAQARGNQPASGGEPKAAMRHFNTRQAGCFSRIHPPHDMRWPTERSQFIDTFCFIRGKCQLQFAAFRTGNPINGQLLVKQGESMPIGCEYEALEWVHARAQTRMQYAKRIARRRACQRWRTLNERNRRPLASPAPKQRRNRLCRRR